MKEAFQQSNLLASVETRWFEGVWQALNDTNSVPRSIG